MVKDGKIRIMISLSKEDDKKLEALAKARSKELGLTVTKSDIVSQFINGSGGVVEHQTVVVSNPIQVDGLNSNTRVALDNLDELSPLQRMIYFLNWDYRLSYAQIGALFNPSLSERGVKDYRYGKVKTPSEDKAKQLIELCKERGYTKTDDYDELLKQYAPREG